MSLFEDKSQGQVKQTEVRVAGNGPIIRDSGAYPAKVKAFYATTASTGNRGLVLIAELEDGSEFTQSIWPYNKDTGSNVRRNQDGTEEYTSGWQLADGICRVTTGKSLPEIGKGFEDKMLELWNKDEGKKVPTSVPVATALIGKPIILGIIRQTEFVRVQDANKNWVDSADTRDTNTLDTVFFGKDPSKPFSAYEIEHKKAEPSLYPNWTKRWTGVTKDRTQGKKPVNTGKTAPQATAPTEPVDAGELFK